MENKKVGLEIWACIQFKISVQCRIKTTEGKLTCRAVKGSHEERADY